MPKSHIRSQSKGFIKSHELHRATDHHQSELLTRGHDSDAPWWSDPSCFCLSDALTVTSQRFPAGIRYGIMTSGHIAGVFILSLSPELGFCSSLELNTSATESESPWQSENLTHHWTYSPLNLSSSPLHTHVAPGRWWENQQFKLL